MTAEFTGERVVPGHVDVDLWNEHVARYAFAARLCRNRRVLDMGCGTGYGSAELALNAQLVTGVDVSNEAIAYAAANFDRPNLRWVQSSAISLPFAAGAFDLVVAFEVIEHLADWQLLLEEAKRVMAPGGQFIVSTPNKHFYAETRRDSGPNPFHEHEFEYDEFRDALSSVFPSVSMFVEDHVEGILFRAVASRGGADVRLEGRHDPPHDSNFFIAVCAMTAQTGAPTFIYIPRAANVLKERAVHIDRLRGELDTKDGWLRAAQEEHAQLVREHSDQTAELQRNNTWAQQLDSKLKSTGERVLALQGELEQQEVATREMVAGYEQQIAKASEELAHRTEWAQSNEAQLTARTAELARTVELLDKAEATVEERSKWALDLQQQCDALRLELAKVRASRWMRLGRAFGLGPEIDKG